jgi:sterol desaturase/sphingolipid hydroxylase (fatty acid hydroxylase superfamily)
MDPVLVVAGAGALMLFAERLVPGVRQPIVPNWWGRVVLANIVQVGIVYLGAVTWDRWLPGLRLADARTLGQLPGIALGYLAITFVFYWWHRARHEIPLLWRWLHQIHHSAARIEVVTSFYKHPLEITINGVLSSAVLNVLVGLPPASAAVVVALTGLAELFYHWNVRTPYWLGFLVQRPESHRRHHERGHHRDNYSDLPLWDWLFGTLDNPSKPIVHCGFEPARERQLGRMLIGKTPR